MDERKKERQWYLETQLDVMGRREDEMTYNATLKPGAPGSGAVAPCTPRQKTNDRYT